MYAKVRNLLLVTALCAGLFWVSGAFGEQNTYVIDLDGNGDFISTPDADSFRRSEVYLTGQIARAVARGQRGQ